MKVPILPQKYIQLESNLVFNKINRIMRNHTVYILILLLLCSCENFLEETPVSFVSKANFYQNESDAEAAITGAYSTIGTDFFGVGYYLVVTLHADYINGRGSQAVYSAWDQPLPSNNLSGGWSNFYAGINRANAVIGNVPAIESISESVKSRILAEAYFLRALIYFELVRGWGPVPLRIEESVDLTGKDMARSSENEIYKQIIEDALIAEKDLPESVGSMTGRPSKWAAKMLLAQVYLTLENWNEAAVKADEIIKSGYFSLVLVSKPNDFYKIFHSQTHSEDIMSVHHSELKQSSIPTYIHRGNTYPYNSKSGGYYAWLPITTGNSIIGERWDNNDLRKEFNLYSRYLNAKGDTVSLPAEFPVLFKKFITDDKGMTTSSVPIFRYSEALLIYAEAACMAQETPPSLALERLNMIKRRAYGYDPTIISPIDYSTGMSKKEFRDAVLNERCYEFILERRRWWDLKRTGKVIEAQAVVGRSVNNARLLFPIPDNEMLNNELIGENNPGY